MERRTGTKSYARTLILLLVGCVLPAIASLGKPFQIGWIKPKSDASGLTFSFRIGRLDISGHSELYRFATTQPILLLSRFGGRSRM